MRFTIARVHTEDLAAVQNEAARFGVIHLFGEAHYGLRKAIGMELQLVGGVA